MSEGAPKPYKPTGEEIDEGYKSMDAQQEHDSHRREEASWVANRLEGKKTTHVYEMRKIIKAFSEDLDLSEAGGALNEKNSPEMTNDREEARRILVDINQKLNYFQGLFKFGTPK